jgi:hypothetical protein
LVFETAPAEVTVDGPKTLATISPTLKWLDYLVNVERQFFS